MVLRCRLLLLLLLPCQAQTQDSENLLHVAPVAAAVARDNAFKEVMRHRKAVVNVSVIPQVAPANMSAHGLLGARDRGEAVAAAARLPPSATLGRETGDAGCDMLSTRQSMSRRSSS